MNARWLLVVASVALGGCGDQASGPQAEPTFLTERTSEATPVTSREFKVLLDPARFTADPDEAVAALEREVLELVENELQRPHDKSLAVLDKVRSVRFFDVPSTCAFRAQGFVLRERVEDGDREVTLKFRSNDRYLAAAADVEPADANDAKTKLEEDVKPPYTSVFSHSTKLPIADDVVFNRFATPLELFPGLDEVELPADTTLALVSELDVYERVYGDLEVDLGKQEAEMGVTLWYASPDDETPAVAELSFSYQDDEEDFSTKSVRRGKQLFELLQGLDWVAASSTTKTSFAYGFEPTFCADSASP